MWEYLKTVERPIVLYGTGNAADKIIAECGKREIPIAGVFASDGFVRNREFAGFPVISYSEAKERFHDMIVLLCFGSHLDDVLSIIRKVDREQELYAPDLAIAGEGLFTKEFRKQHQAEIEEVLSSLADEKSKQVLMDCIAYKETGKLEYLYRCETDDDDNWALLGIGPEESYLDLGAYTGDTVKQFLSYTKTYKKIYAVEPDDRNFRKLSEATAEFRDCECYHLAISDRSAQIEFSKNKGRGGGIGKGMKMIEADSVDNLLKGREVSLIKMDLEGQEPLAIEGAVETIWKYKPKMLISAYHRVDDLWAIPLKVLKINPEYKVYLRKSPCLPAWEINYYFV